MNDRFSVQLRQHLLQAANERPAAGQVAAVDARIAITAQRRPLVARLTWFPGRIGPFPSAAVRYGLVVLALALATVVAAAIFASTPRPPSTVFEGSWTSTDAGDGSTQSLVVGEGTAPTVHFVDNVSTGGACVADAVKVFTADGTGKVNGNELDVRWPNGGGCGLRTVGMGDGTYTYHASTDTIVDGQRLTWRRVQGGVAPPTRGPLSTIIVTRDTSPCFDIPASTSYRNDVGPLSLTVTIPTAASYSWEGARDSFSVADSCWFSGPVGIRASIVTAVNGSCDTGAWVEVGTPAEAVAALADAKGVAISEPTSVTLGGHAAARFEVSPDARMCFDQVQLWNEVILERGMTIIYLVDVDGVPLGITIGNRSADVPAAEIAEAEAILASLQVGAAKAPYATSGPLPTPDPGCIQFHGTGTYTAPVGPLSVSATLPDEPDSYWHGLRDSFSLLRSPCQFDAALTFEGSLITQVPPDACHWESPGIEVADAAAAAAALDAQAGTDATGQTELTIDGYPAVRLEISVPADFDTNNCDGGGQVGLWPMPDGETARIDSGPKATVYLVDVEGSILAIRERHETGDDVDDPSLVRQIDEIIGSLQIKP